MKRRPLKWIQEASPEEIAEAIIAVDIRKATATAMYLTDRIGREAGSAANDLERRIKQDPAGTIGNALSGAIRGVLGR